MTVLRPEASPHLPERMLFQWHITDRCNLNCSHCYQQQPLAADPSWDELMEMLAQIKGFITACREASPGGRFRAHITVTGGEPFIRTEFMDMLKILAGERWNFSFAILTNGTMLDRKKVNELKGLRPSFVQVSIDGAPETHDRIRGSGSYERAVQGARLLARGGIPLYLSFTANAGNYREFTSVASLGRKLGAARVWSDRMVPCGAASTSGERAMTADETCQYVKLMGKELQRRRWFRRSPVLLHRSLQFAATGERPYRCTAGDSLLTILPNGDICPCRRMPVVAGNILNNRLLDIYHGSPLLLGLRDRERISSGCEHCFYARTCGGGARCISWAVHGDPFMADPGCWMRSGQESVNSKMEAL